MKIYLSTILILICGVTSFAQNRKTTNRPSFSNTPFNLEVTKLPANYMGHDARRVFDSLSLIRLESECGKFERSTDCQSRIEKLQERDIWKGINIKDNLAFSFEIEDCDYSPDEEVLTCPKFNLLLEGFGSEYTWSHRLVNSHEYIGQNGFGVKKSITYRLFENIHINYGEEGGIKIKIEKISPEIAQSLIPKLRMLLVGSPRMPWADSKTAVYEPTIKDPNKTIGDNKTVYINLESIMIYDFTTGKIYRRTS